MKIVRSGQIWKTGMYFRGSTNRTCSHAYEVRREVRDES